MVYLDASATAPLLPEARVAMQRIWDAGSANAASVHSAGQWAHREIEAARETIASAFGIHPDGVVFTSGGTEANNLGIIGQSLANPRGRMVVTSPVEHSSVLASCDYLQRMHGFSLEYLPVDSYGQVVVDSINDDAAVVAVGLANAEVGTVMDLSALASGVPVHIDAVQAAAQLPISLATDGWPGSWVSTVAIASHKFGGPQGVGALLLPRDIPLEPVLHGGNQEGGRRAGTSNVAGIVGFAAAVKAVYASIGSRATALMTSRDALVNAVLNSVPGAKLTGHPTERLPGHASFVFDGVSGESLLIALDTAGYAVSSGSACRAGESGPSPVLVAMGYDDNLAQSALRFSLPEPLPNEHIARIVQVLRSEIYT